VLENYHRTKEVQVMVMKQADKSKREAKLPNHTKPIPAKSVVDLPPCEEMVSQLLKNQAMTEEDIRALD